MLEKIADYIIEKELGGGGVGVVYRARKGRDLFALKVLREDLKEKRTVQEKFRDGARIMQRLQHPHIVKVYNSGICTAGEARIPYFVMELLEGNLDEMNFERLNDEEKFKKRLRIGQQIFSALAYTHRRGIAHRDVWPANILFDKDGNVKLGDFDFAKIIQESGEFKDFSSEKKVARSLTTRERDHSPVAKRSIKPQDEYIGLDARDLSVQGMMLYAAPEVKENEVKKYEDYFKADVFSACLVLNELFTETKPSIFAALIKSPKNIDPGFPEEIDTLIRKGLERLPKERGSAQEAHDTLFYDFYRKVGSVRKLLEEKDASLGTTPIQTVVKILDQKKILADYMNERQTYLSDMVARMFSELERAIKAKSEQDERTIYDFVPNEEVEKNISRLLKQKMSKQKIDERAMAYLDLRKAWGFITEGELKKEREEVKRETALKLRGR